MVACGGMKSGDNMKIYDISMSISTDMPVYKNKAEKRPVINTRHEFPTSNTHESTIELDLHTGTHLDAPLHMIQDGNTVDETDLYRVVRKCKVLDLTSVSTKITKADLINQVIVQGDFLLLKTRNSDDLQFNADFIYLDQSGAQYLKDQAVAGVGIDALGIERNQPGHETHHLLLGNDIVILEGLRLSEVEAGAYFLIAPPLKIRGVEAAPVRAILIEF